MDAMRLRRSKATTFLPESVFDLSQAFVVPLKHVPVDGLKALKNDKEAQIAGINIPKYTHENPASPDSGAEGDIMYKTLASVPIDEPDLVYTHLLQLSQCYEAMATNQKIVAFASNMSVRKAFYGLIYNSTRTGLIVDSKSYNIIGVLSATDFIMVLMKLWKFQRQITKEKLTPQMLVDIVGCMPVSRWKEHQKLDGDCYREFITADIRNSLFHAVQVLTDRRLHRLPVMDSETNDCMFILTHRRLLHFLWNFCLSLPKPPYMRESVCRLKLGCWADIKYVEESTPLIETLDVLIGEQISGMPVVADGCMRVVNVYTRFDAIAVAFDRNFERLDMPVAEAIAQRRKLFGDGGHDSVVTVAERATMWQVLEVFIEKNVHRVFAVDEDDNLKGVISLSDMISYMVIRPTQSKENGNGSAM